MIAATLRGSHARDARAQRRQLLLESLVASIDLMHAADDRLALGDQRRHQQRNARANIRTRDPIGLAPQPAGPADQGPVWIAQDDAGSHADQAVDEEESALVHLL